MEKVTYVLKEHQSKYSEFQKIPEERDKLIQLLTSLINQGLNHQN